MTIDKKINYEEGLIKQKFLADLKERFEKAKDAGFKGDIREFILKEKIRNIGLAKGGQPNGATTFTSSDWNEYLKQIEIKKMELDEDYLPKIIDPEEVKKIKIKPEKVAFKYGATSQSEEDLIGRHVDDWTNLIDKGELDPSVDFMKYIDMILGRSGANRGGIVSVI